VYPDYKDDVVLLAVGFQSGQTVDALDRHWMSNQYPGIVAEAPNNMARDYGVTTQSTKLGIARDGEVLFRHGYGTSSADTWRERLRSLAEG